MANVSARWEIYKDIKTWNDESNEPSRNALEKHFKYFRFKYPLA